MFGMTGHPPSPLTLREGGSRGVSHAPTFEHHSRIMVQPSDFLERCDKSMILARMLCYIMAHAIYDVE